MISWSLLENFLEEKRIPKSGRASFGLLEYSPSSGKKSIKLVKLYLAGLYFSVFHATSCGTKRKRSRTPENRRMGHDINILKIVITPTCNTFVNVN